MGGRGGERREERVRSTCLPPRFDNPGYGPALRLSSADIYMLLQPGGDSLTPRIEIALRPLSAEQLGMATAQTLHQLSPRSVTKPIWHYLIT